MVTLAATTHTQHTHVRIAAPRMKTQCICACKKARMQWEVPLGTHLCTHSWVWTAPSHHRTQATRDFQRILRACIDATRHTIIIIIGILDEATAQSDSRCQDTRHTSSSHAISIGSCHTVVHPVSACPVWCIEIGGGPSVPGWVATFLCARCAMPRCTQRLVASRIVRIRRGETAL